MNHYSYATVGKLIPILCFSMFIAGAKAQVVNGKSLKDYGMEVGEGVPRKIQMGKSHIIKIVDGVIFKNGFVATNKVDAEWIIKNSILPEEDADSIRCTNTKNSPEESYLFSRVTLPDSLKPYKLPIIVNQRFYEKYNMRQEALKYVNLQEIKKIVYVPRSVTVMKYCADIVFGAIEVYW